MPKPTKKPRTRATKSQKTRTTETTVKQTMPGYVDFTKAVLKTLVNNRGLFLKLALLGWTALLLITGVTQFTYYAGLTQSTNDVAGNMPAGPYRTVIEVIALSASIVSGTASSLLSEAQQIFTWLLYLMVWLVVVWLLRHRLSGSTVTLRDGLYSAMSPLISTCLVILAGLVQLIPFALVVALIGAVASSGAVGGVLWSLIGMVLVIAAAAATLYWLVGTIFAAVIVTLPGTYPWASLRSARQVITGYRKRIILRLLWLCLVLFVLTAAVIVPVVLLDALTGYHISPLVTLVSAFVSISAFMYGSSYVYLLYRGVIDERG